MIRRQNISGNQTTTVTQTHATQLSRIDTCAATHSDPLPACPAAASCCCCCCRNVVLACVDERSCTIGVWSRHRSAKLYRIYVDRPIVHVRMICVDVYLPYVDTKISQLKCTFWFSKLANHFSVIWRGCRSILDLVNM